MAERNDVYLDDVTDKRVSLLRVITRMQSGCPDNVQASVPDFDFDDGV